MRQTPASVKVSLGCLLCPDESGASLKQEAGSKDSPDLSTAPGTREFCNLSLRARSPCPGGCQGQQGMTEDATQWQRWGLLRVEHHRVSGDKASPKQPLSVCKGNLHICQERHRRASAAETSWADAQ